jgi:hypothetical protein
MARFPKTEEEIISAAEVLIRGLRANPTVFPAPPLSVAEIQILLDTFIESCEKSKAHKAAAKIITRTKKEARDDLTYGMRADFKYGETATGPTCAQLPLIGWDRPKTASAPDLPGIPRSFEVTRQGEGWVLLDWKSPADGGPVVSYQIECREYPAGDWAIAGMALKTESMLSHHDKGIDLEYRVVPVNKTGPGKPSATVSVKNYSRDFTNATDKLFPFNE